MKQTPQDCSPAKEGLLGSEKPQFILAFMHTGEKKNSEIKKQRGD